MVYKTVNKGVHRPTKREIRELHANRWANKAIEAAAKAEDAAKPKPEFIVGGTRAENIAAYKKCLHELAKIQRKRYLTKKEAAEVNKLVHYLQVEPFLADIFREMQEESEKYPQYLHDVPEWAQN